jgi:hypothetical protein
MWLLEAACGCCIAHCKSNPRIVAHTALGDTVPSMDEAMYSTVMHCVLLEGTQPTAMKLEGSFQP